MELTRFAMVIGSSLILLLGYTMWKDSESSDDKILSFMVVVVAFLIFLLSVALLFH